MRRKYRGKKSRSEAQDYKNIISRSSFSPEGTIPIHNEFLRGSAELCHDDEKLNTSGKVKKTPLQYRVLDWIKKHIVPSVVAALLVAGITSFITQRIRIEVINSQIRTLEKQIKDIDDNYVDKELLSYRLNEISSKLDSNISISLNDIEWQLKELEEKINSLK